jgi:hypothetical protein
VPRSLGKVKCNAATPADKSMPGGKPFFSWRRKRLMVATDEMESAMRMIRALGLVAVCGMLTCAPAWAYWVPSFKANDTGGIIAYQQASQIDVRQIAADHCAYYGKVAKFLAADPQYGGYISFACRQAPSGADERPVRSR